jgi:general secretion pathway protein K
MKRRRYTNERGIALISTVYITLFLALLAATLSITARSQAVLLRSNADRLMARELAMAAIDLGIGDVIRPKSDRRIPRDGRIVSLSLATGQASIAIQDESGKLDLNAAPIETLKPLFINIGKEAGLDAFAASTIAEKLASIEPVKGETTGERGRLQSVAELRIIPGVTEAFYRQIAPHVTVYSRQALINPMTATRAVLSSLPGMDRASVERLIAVRDRGEARPSFDQAENFFADAEGTVFSITAEGRTQSGVIARITAVVAAQGGGVVTENTGFKIIEMR